MSAEQVYDRLRSIGCSVETSDALASIVAELSDKKREAFFLWACGMTQDEAAKKAKINTRTMERMLKSCREKVYNM